jgi:hypothetical protein
MRNDSQKINGPELLVDWNGNAVQSWVLGGRTITVAAGSDFECESTLLRVCNTGGSAARLFLKDADYASWVKDATDAGMPILPNTCVTLGVFQKRQVYTVQGGSLDITFVPDRRVTQTTNIPASPAFTPSTYTQDISKVSGPGAVANILADNVLQYSGTLQSNVQGKYLVGIEITPTVSFADFPDVRVRVVDQFGERYYGKDYFSSNKLVQYFEVDQIPSIDFVVEIVWNKDNMENFYVKIDRNTTQFVN